MIFKWLARVVLIGGYLAVCIYAAVTETGPIGWINYAQQSVFGAYSQKMTMLIALVASVVVVGPLWWAIDSLARRMGLSEGLPTAAEISGANAPVTNRGLLLSSLVAIPVIWIGGYAIWWAIEHQHREDASARYEPLELARGAPVALPANGYVSVHGRLLWQRTVAFTKGSGSTPEYTLVPLVAKDWRDGEPVPFVTRVDNSNRYLAERSSRSGSVLLGRTDGAVAVPAAQEFRKMGLPIDAATQLLRLIPSENGAPVVRDTAASDRQIYVWLALGCSVFYVFMMGIMILVRWNHDRKQRSRQRAA
ncbi:MAG: hypothetical protein K8R60_10525 [Burkholderiales bacterium]|nr:hypothetical protein [Burkholderiales bacterium]